jgi:hypothetical protein
MNKTTIAKKAVPVIYMKRKEVLPWVKITRSPVPPAPVFPRIIMPEQPEGYIKVKKHDFL